ncbi:MAG: hypothetical protein RIS64_3271 [Bacteroidota bacterium]|jgi:hypothetical protein
MEEKLIKQLRNDIYKYTHILVNKYKSIDALLKTLEPNHALTEYIQFSEATTAYYIRKFPAATVINLKICKVQQEPILGLNKIEQAFVAAEQGFYQLYPDEAFHQKITKVFRSTDKAYEQLTACLKKVVNT